MSEEVQKQYFSTSEVGLMLGLSTRIVRQKFAGKPGILVVSLGASRTHLRIPKTLIDAYIAKHSAKVKPSRRRV